MAFACTNLAAAASSARLDTLSLSDLHSWLVVDCSRAHALLDLAGHGQECLFDVGCVLRGSLKEWDAQTVGELLHAA